MPVGHPDRTSDMTSMAGVLLCLVVTQASCRETSTGITGKPFIRNVKVGLKKESATDREANGSKWK